MINRCESVVRKAEGSYVMQGELRCGQCQGHIGPHKGTLPGGGVWVWDDPVARPLRRSRPEVATSRREPTDPVGYFVDWMKRLVS